MTAKNELEGQGEQEEQASVEPETVDAEVSAEDIAPRLSRRQRIEEEKKETAASIKSANDRADEAARVAKEIAEQFGRFREEMPRQLADQFQRFVPQQQYQERPQPQYQPPDTRAIQKKMKEALTGADMDSYLELSEQLAGAKAESMIAQFAARMPRPQQTFEKPMWIQVVEHQYPDVVMHERGTAVVTGYAQAGLAMGKSQQEALQDAFRMARQSLGTGARPEKETNSVTVDRQALMGNAKATGGSGGAAARVNPTGKVTVRGLPSNYKQIAKSAGMTPERYVKHWIAGNPDSVEKK